MAVVVLHAIGWRIAMGGLPPLAARPAGVRRIAWIAPTPHPRPASADAPAAKLDRNPGARTVGHAPPSAHAPYSPGEARRTPVAAPARPVTGNGGRAAPKGEPAVAAWPVYPTRPPPPAVVRYALVESSAAGASASASASASAPGWRAGDAELEWTHDADTFSLRLRTTIGDRPAREWQSSGGFDAAGVAPARLVERERGRDKRAINFDHVGGSVRFSGSAATLPAAAGVQDRWSWLAQLAAIAEAAAARGSPVDAGTRWELRVAGLRGELERWTFRVLSPGGLPVAPPFEGNDLSMAGDRASDLLHVVRVPDRPYDLRIEAWLSPSLHHLPAGLRMSTPPGGWSLSLWRRPS